MSSSNYCFLTCIQISQEAGQLVWYSHLLKNFPVCCDWGAGGKGDDRGWDGWMASPTWWTWVWVNSWSWWSTGRPGVLQFMALQRVGHDWVTELNWNWTDTVKGFGIINKEEVDVFLELSCFSYDPMDVGNLISGSSVFSKSSLNIWNFTVHILLKPDLENFEYYFTSVCCCCC